MIALSNKIRNKKTKREKRGEREKRRKKWIEIRIPNNKSFDFFFRFVSQFLTNFRADLIFIGCATSVVLKV